MAVKTATPLRLATPGLYIQELSAFPNSAVNVPTAIPAFVGFTERAIRNGQSLIGRPVRISSLAEYHQIFGGGVNSTFSLQLAGNNINDYDFSLDGRNYLLAPDAQSRFLFYNAIRFFFANGGGACYVVSVGPNLQPQGAQAARKKDDTKEVKVGEESNLPVAMPAAKVVATRFTAISRKALEEGITALVGEEEPTMLVVPEAVLLDEDECYVLQQAMLQHCGYKMRNRFAILDVYNGWQKRTYDEQDVINRFRENVGNNCLDFGAAYYPWIQTAVVSPEEVSYRNISTVPLLVDLLNREAELNYDNPKRAEEIKAEVRRLAEPTDNPAQLHQTLQSISPIYKALMNKVRTLQNLMPPSAAIAGLYTTVDATRGVWKAPANTSLVGVLAPAVKLTHEDQEDLNTTVSGKSINGIRSFAGEGTLVWGARTLDGNSQDWRYVNVRRTLIYIQQSIKNACRAYVYEPNTTATWVLIKSMISSFLNDLWRQGGLVGVTQEAAYEVDLGIGTTMTPNDVLDGIMRISVKVAVSRPAEFIVVTFQQKMLEA